MKTIVDDEFGVISVRRQRNARRLTIRFNTRRELVATTPPYMPLFTVRSTIERSRQSIRQLISQQRKDNITYLDNSQIGKSHFLSLTPAADFSSRRSGNTLNLTYPSDHAAKDEAVQAYIRPEVVKLLRIQAKHYLPRRLDHFAALLDCSYTSVRFSHASSRWGSCSAKGTISLNIALMNLPFELIDYVIIHELCHTKEMNHSAQFWQLVEQADPDYKAHRQALKNHHPNV